MNKLQLEDLLFRIYWIVTLVFITLVLIIASYLYH